MKLPSTPQELIKGLPKELKQLLFKQWGAKQSPEWHPEGNALKHILVVLKRAYIQYNSNPTLVVSALFHDLGKIDTYATHPVTNRPTTHGHANKSLEYVNEYSDWINTIDDVDIEDVKYVVGNHMKIKPYVWDSMRNSKKEKITNHPSYDKLTDFGKIDKGGIAENKISFINKILKEANI